MQTFLPYPDFERSARALDNRRLGKQRVEVLQILNSLTGAKRGWYFHPAVRMWIGHEVSLIQYGIEICTEWHRRGFNDTCFEKIMSFLFVVDVTTDDPGWLGCRSFHAAHRSNLLRKEPGFYSQYGWKEPHDLPYIWPRLEEM